VPAELEPATRQLASGQLVDDRDVGRLSAGVTPQSGSFQVGNESLDVIRVHEAHPGELSIVAKRRVRAPPDVPQDSTGHLLLENNNRDHNINRFDQDGHECAFLNGREQ
jgi:hypothetical protein